ncbi:AAA family ATPase [Yoonia sp. BS5-3]|uniref:AAA family ATPase n=1 Tax=Yoonia phaeophyticola TaxID=3137369 RepID=A0ABZ2V6W1_9RHOB
MIIVLNGYPGVGKLTVGRELAVLLKARLVDIHTLYNLAFALTEFRTPEFRETVRRVEAIADELIAALPSGTPVIFTTVLTGETEWAMEEWRRFLERSDRRPPLVMVHIACDLEENIKRIQSPERRGKGKLQDAEVAERNHASSEPLIGGELPHTFRLNVTYMKPEEAADKIANHCVAVLAATKDVG